MAWTESATAQKLSAKLNDGTTTSGAVKTVAVNMGTLAVNGWDAAKAGAIIDAYGAIADKALYQAIHTEEKLLVDE